MVLRVALRRIIKGMFAILTQLPDQLDDAEINYTSELIAYKTDTYREAYAALTHTRYMMKKTYDPENSFFPTLLAQLICPVTLDIFYQDLLGLKYASSGASEWLTDWRFGWGLEDKPPRWWNDDSASSFLKGSLLLEAVRLLPSLAYYTADQHVLPMPLYRSHNRVLFLMPLILLDVCPYLTEGMRRHTKIMFPRDPILLPRNYQCSLLFLKAVFLVMVLGFVNLVYIHETVQSMATQADLITMVLPGLVEGCKRLTEGYIDFHLDSSLLFFFLSSWTLTTQLGRTLDLTYAIVKTGCWDRFLKAIKKSVKAVVEAEKEDVAQRYRSFQGIKKIHYKCNSFLDLLFQAQRLLQFMCMLVPPNALAPAMAGVFFTPSWIRSILFRRPWLAVSCFYTTQKHLHASILRDIMAFLEWGVRGIDRFSSEAKRNLQNSLGLPSEGNKPARVNAKTDMLWIHLQKRFMRYAIRRTFEHMVDVDREGENFLSTMLDRIATDGNAQSSSSINNHVALEPQSMTPKSAKSNVVSSDIPASSRTRYAEGTNSVLPGDVAELSPRVFGLLKPDSFCLPPSTTHGLIPGSGGRVASWIIYLRYLRSQAQHTPSILCTPHVSFRGSQQRQTGTSRRHFVKTFAKSPDSYNLLDLPDYTDLNISTWSDIPVASRLPGVCTCIQPLVDFNKQTRRKSIGKPPIAPIAGGCLESQREGLQRGKKSREIPAHLEPEKESLQFPSFVQHYLDLFRRVVHSNSLLVPTFENGIDIYVPFIQKTCPCDAMASRWIIHQYGSLQAIHRQQRKGLAICLLDLFGIRGAGAKWATVRHTVSSSMFSASGGNSSSSRRLMVPDWKWGLKDPVITSLFEQPLSRLFCCIVEGTSKQLIAEYEWDAGRRQNLTGSLASSAHPYSDSLTLDSRTKVSQRSEVHRCSLIWMLKDALDSLDIMGTILTSLRTKSSFSASRLEQSTALRHDEPHGKVSSASGLCATTIDDDFQLERWAPRQRLHASPRFQRSRKELGFLEKEADERSPINMLIISEEIWPKITASMLYGTEAGLWCDDYVTLQHCLVRHSPWLQNILGPLIMSYEERYPSRSLELHFAATTLDIQVVQLLPDSDKNLCDTASPLQLTAQPPVAKQDAATNYLGVLDSQVEPYLASSSAEQMRDLMDSSGAGGRFNIELTLPSDCVTEASETKASTEESSGHCILLNARRLTLVEVVVLETLFQSLNPVLPLDILKNMPHQMTSFKTFEEVCSSVPSIPCLSSSIVHDTLLSLVEKRILANEASGKVAAFGYCKMSIPPDTMFA